MFVLYEDAGKFHTGRVLSEAEASAQVELETGKRVKVKSAHILLRFDKPSPADLLAGAQRVAAEIELALAWEFAPEEEFGFADLAREYFSAQASLEQQAAALLRLFEAPHYFRRAGKGRFRKAPAEIVQQALAAIEKKKQVQAQIDGWAGELAAGQCPDAIREQLFRILFKPDKNSPEYKAVVEAARSTQLAPLNLLRQAGAIESAYQFHWKRFLFEHFPKGTGFPPLEAPPITDELPLAPVPAWSIDDSATTEIDDALSVQGLGSGTVTLGVHIAAPGLALAPASAVDQVARQRLSTVYMPGHKITMLPDAVVQAYTLQEGRDCPAVSLYVRFDEATLAIQGADTRLERVAIAHNLRHDKLDATITEPWLEDPSNPEYEGDPVPEPAASLRPELSFLWRLARHLKGLREVVRGKPETFNRPDYNFRLVDAAGDEPSGQEQVEISVRRRGAPLDLIVAEAMILANSQWGQWLAELGVPAIYRSQASLAPGVKVRMGTKPAPHAGIGVKCYAWSTSPLRRYTDLVNQWQIIAAARHGRTAALAAPFKPKDAELFSIISSFDAAYSTYNAYQAGMERFWTLRYLAQRGIQELDATVFKEGLVRADTLPLVLPVMGTNGLPRGARVRVRLGAVDEIALDLGGTVSERLDAEALPTGAEDDGADDDEPVAGPLAIAVDLSEADAGETPSSAPAAG
ncbi:MAG: RNB domain-containing ribonuclease [Ramlibacter sp.]|uniref:ribonuclease catalytic domain-containing protein n=1 Tax=Ramlibacter sp. TaxID=1917967 RepID=UPI0026239FB6|nr:RNB domain-containing ribonuclease [Ramlibacter sp.]MDH4377081.1 RNB domain-containing ribonuclease [Ramlibacter sp.]